MRLIEELSELSKIKKKVKKVSFKMKLHLSSIVAKLFCSVIN
jgi:hypothetical protein